MPEQDNDLQQQYLDALGVFVDKYEPCKQNEVTDLFTSTEINSIIRSHTGTHIDLTELHKLMLQMGFNYELHSGEFVWLCKQKD